VQRPGKFDPLEPLADRRELRDVSVRPSSRPLRAEERHSADDRIPHGDDDHRYEVVEVNLPGVLHGVNDSGVSVGHIVNDEGAMRAVRVEAGKVHDLGTLGGSASSARGINAEGLIVGGALLENDSAHHGFVFENGRMHDLNDLIVPEDGWEIIHALGINNAGDIIAIAHRDGEDHVVLLKRRRAQGDL